MKEELKAIRQAMLRATRWFIVNNSEHPCEDYEDMAEMLERELVALDKLIESHEEVPPSHPAGKRNGLSASSPESPLEWLDSVQLEDAVTKAVIDSENTKYPLLDFPARKFAQAAIATIKRIAEGKHG